MPPVGFEPTISAGERLQTYALDRVATGTGNSLHIQEQNSSGIEDKLDVRIQIKTTEEQHTAL